IPDEPAAGRDYAAVALPARAEQRGRPDILFQFLSLRAFTTEDTKDTEVKPFKCFSLVSFVSLVVMSSLSARQRGYLNSRIVEARAVAKIGQRVGHERSAREAVARAAAPEPLRQAHRSGTEDRQHLQRAVHLAEIV